MFDDNEIPVGVDFRRYIQTEIDESVRDGFVLLFVTENLENNDWIK